MEIIPNRRIPAEARNHDLTLEIGIIYRPSISFHHLSPK
jgi:hypothetical protein